jgi:hypothetical protein
MKKKAKKTEAPKPSVKRKRDAATVRNEIIEAAKEFAARKTTSAMRIIDLGEELMAIENPVDASDF